MEKKHSIYNIMAFSCLVLFILLNILWSPAGGKNLVILITPILGFFVFIIAEWIRDSLASEPKGDGE